MKIRKKLFFIAEILGRLVLTVLIVLVLGEMIPALDLGSFISQRIGAFSIIILTSRLMGGRG